MAKLNFQHHYSSLQCHMILQKSFYCRLICFSRNISYYYQLCVFVETMMDLKDVSSVTFTN